VNSGKADSILFFTDEYVVYIDINPKMHAFPTYTIPKAN